jgi:uncharacterized protein (DUF2141 family)
VQSTERRTNIDTARFFRRISDEAFPNAHKIALVMVPRLRERILGYRRHTRYLGWSHHRLNERSDFMKRLPALATLSLLALCSTPPIASAQQAPETAIIRADIKNLRNNTGQVGCMLFRSADGFSGSTEKAVQRLLLPIKDKAVTCEFKGVSPGVYAIASIHDENANGKLDRPTFGAPTEGWGTSRDAKAGFMHGPRFEDAALRFPAGTSTISISIHYP